MQNSSGLSDNTHVYVSSYILIGFSYDVNIGSISIDFRNNMAHSIVVTPKITNDLKLSSTALLDVSF